MFSLQCSDDYLLVSSENKELRLYLIICRKSTSSIGTGARIHIDEVCIHLSFPLFLILSLLSFTISLSIYPSLSLTSSVSLSLSYPLSLFLFPLYHLSLSHTLSISVSLPLFLLEDILIFGNCKFLYTNASSLSIALFSYPLLDSTRPYFTSLFSIIFYPVILFYLIAASSPLNSTQFNSTQFNSIQFAFISYPSSSGFSYDSWSSGRHHSLGIFHLIARREGFPPRVLVSAIDYRLLCISLTQVCLALVKETTSKRQCERMIKQNQILLKMFYYSSYH